jgi:hypothetical protein
MTSALVAGRRIIRFEAGLAGVLQLTHLIPVICMMIRDSSDDLRHSHAKLLTTERKRS